MSLGAIVDPALAGLILVAIVAVALLAPMLLARRRAPEEQGRVPLYETVCSGYFGWFAGTNIPSIRLAIYDSFLVVTWLSPRVIPLSQIKKARVSHFMLGRCVLIEPQGGVAYRLSAKDPERIVALLNRT